MVERARSGQQGGGAGRGGAVRRGGRRRRIHGNFLVFAISFNKARAPAQPFSRSKVNGSRQSVASGGCGHSEAMVLCHSDAAIAESPSRIVCPSIRVLRLLLVALLIAASPARAAGDDTTRQTLDSARSTIADIETALKADNLSDSDLVRLRAAGDPLAVQLQAVIVDLSPRLEASAKRLAELTPKSKEPAVADSASPELAAEKQKHDALDADLRSARAMLLQIDDIDARIGARAARPVHPRDLRAIVERA